MNRPDADDFASASPTEDCVRRHATLDPETLRPWADNVVTLSRGSFKAPAKVVRHYGAELMTALSSGIHPPFGKPYQRRVVLPEKLVDDFAALTGSRGSGEGSVKGAPNNWPDARWGAAKLPSDTRIACRYPYPPVVNDNCQCHAKMGNDFYFLPSDQCLFDTEPEIRAMKIRILATGALWFVIGGVIAACGIAALWSLGLWP